MAKKYLQDVIPPNQKRSIRNIPLPNSRENKIPSQSVPTSNEAMGDVRVKEPVQENTPKNPEPPKTDDHSDYHFSEDRPKKRNKVFYLLIIIILIAVGWFFSRTQANVLIYAKSENAFAQNQFDISNKNLQSNEESLGYKILEIEKTATTIVEPSGEEEVSQKASGMIKIYNEYSTNDQKLVERTRFESKNGKVYRIAESISVPGYQEIDGQIVPGEIEVEVFADEDGEDYNIGETEFTIPGFEGLPQYDSMWAESVSEMTGGFIGTKKVVSEESKANSLDSLREEVKNQIKSEINNTSDEFIIVFEENDINYSNLSENNTGDGVQLQLKGSLSTYVFDANELARKITDANIINASPGEVILENEDELSIEIIMTEAEEGDEEADVETIEKLSVEGDAKISWVIDSEKIKKDLVGKNRNQFSEIISSHEGISRAEVDLRPFWKNTFPKESKIEILIQK